MLELALYPAGQAFLTDPWAGLLLEVGFLASFLTPRHRRVEAWRYRFSMPQERAATGAWRQRVPRGPYRPLLGMRRFDD